jgi:hypothetical protein
MRVAARVVAASALTLATACGALDEAPPRSPLGGESTVAAVTATPLASAAAAVTPSNAAVAIDLETAIGLAIEAMAEWLGIPVTQLAVFSAEAVTWPNACIGLTRRGVACADVETPGFRVTLLDAFDNPHSVHLDARGGAVWSGLEPLRGVVSSVDALAATVTVRVDGTAVALRAAPGTIWETGLGGIARLSPGDEVFGAYDASPDGEGPPVIAWLASGE